jgi:CBS domain containing-hemolysin-like protein
MDEVLLRQLVRQLKLMNLWIATFGVLILISLAIVGILLFKAITFLHDATTKLTDTQQKVSQSLDVKQQVCANKSISSLIGQGSNLCK